MLRFLKLPLAEEVALLRMAVSLPAFSLALRIVGFSRLRDWVEGRRIASAVVVGALSRTIELLDIAGRHSPVAGTCLSRSLFVLWYLRRRGVRAELRIGVRFLDSRLDAHAWVEVAGAPVNESADVTERFASFEVPLSPLLPL